MPSGPMPKRVTCPVCRAPEGMACRDPVTFKPAKTHPERQAAADVWYTTPSPDGLTPERRDTMVEDLRGTGLDVGKSMQRITTSADPEAEFARLVG